MIYKFFSAREKIIHAPLLKGDEPYRHDLFLIKDSKRDLPQDTLPMASQWFARKKIQNQGLTNKCGSYSAHELCENKHYIDTGEWYEFTKKEINRMWKIQVDLGLASDKWGSYINSLVLAAQEHEYILENYQTKKKVSYKVDKIFNVGDKRTMTPKQYAEEIKKEIAWGGGALGGVSKYISNLDYYTANNPPYIMERGSGTPPHAIPVTEYNNHNNSKVPSGCVVSPGSWGQSFGDNGLVYIREEDLIDMFQFIGFTVKRTG